MNGHESLNYVLIAGNSTDPLTALSHKTRGSTSLVSAKDLNPPGMFYYSTTWYTSTQYQILNNVPIYLFLETYFKPPSTLSRGSSNESRSERRDRILSRDRPTSNKTISVKAEQVIPHKKSMKVRILTFLNSLDRLFNKL